MAKIQRIIAREVIDSRGWPTVEADVVFDSGTLGRAAVPSGASTGSYEAVELRDGDSSRYLGKGVQQAVAHVSGPIAKALQNFPPGRQGDLDRMLIDLDGSPNKGKLGANAILAVSLAYARASSQDQGVPLYLYIAGLTGKKGDRLTVPSTLPLPLPLPMMNVINGGQHADNELDIQEFMILPCADSFHESLQRGVECFQNLKKILSKLKLSTGLGDEGGFAPAIDSSRRVMEILCEAVQKAGYEAGKDVLFALDVASTELYRDGKYQLRTEEGAKEKTGDVISYYQKLIREFPIVSIEDGLAEEDWAGWIQMTSVLGKKIQIVGDDLFVTNPARLKKGIQDGAANAILIKLNQIGTLTETLEAIRMAQAAGYRTIVSHRSGETEDSFIADLAVGSCAGQIKTGSLSRSERLAKYNQLLRIEEALGPKAQFRGKSLFLS